MIASVPGAIICEQAYARGKMLNHAGWPPFPGGKQFSDIDAVLDNAGRLLFVELKGSSFPASWLAVPTGQRRLYESLLQGRRDSVAVLAHHDIHPGRQIDTSSDVTSAEIAFDEFSQFRRTDNAGWQRLVTGWASNPTAILETLRSSAPKGGAT